MREEFRPAVEALQKDLMDAERKANEIRRAINVLCTHAGDAPLYPDVNDPTAAAPSTIRADTFYGKKLGTAAREYLEMRKTLDQGPAKPREIFEALKLGGYQFEAKDEQIALVSLRAALRKRSNTFHKLPNGEYGLAAWYPDAKKAKPSDSNTDEDDDEESEENSENQVESQSDSDEESDTADEDNATSAV